MNSLLAYFRRVPEVSPQRARRRAARGAAYLDDADPGWHRRLDLDALALADGRSCVLGQLHGTFRRGLGRARLFSPGSAPRASLSPVAHGFHCMQAGDEETKERDYALLNRAWQKEIRDRQLRDRRRKRAQEPAGTPQQRDRPERPQARRALSGEPATDTVPA